VQSFDRTYPHAGFAPSSEVAVFQDFVACLPSRPTRRRSFTLDRHRSHQTGGCPWLLHLEPLPPSHHVPTHRVLAASADAQSHQLHSAFPSISPHTTLGGSHTCQSGFGLAVRLIVGRHHTRLHRTTCPRFPIRLPRMQLGSDRTPISRPLANSLAGNRRCAISALAGIAQLDPLRGGEVWDLTPFQPTFIDLP